MATYIVTLPIAGTFTTQVEADSEEEAIMSALSNGLPDPIGPNDSLELDVFEKIVEGNVSHAPTDEAFAELLDPETDEETQRNSLRGERP